MLLFISGSLNAVMVKMSLERLTGGADAVFVGEVENVRAEWSRDGRLILSLAVLRVQESLKGERPGSRIVVQTKGGSLDGLTLKVSDAPVFRRGEKVLVFLKKIISPDDKTNTPTVSEAALPAFMVWGKAQGKFAFGPDGIARREKYVTTDGESDDGEELSLLGLKNRILRFLLSGNKRMFL